jgi:2-aminophenol/2-amino-5-chlorophenol 1,6-dioxygenase alpha subunit
MSILGAFIVPGTPLPHLCPDQEKWRGVRESMNKVGDRIKELSPDVVIVYSTQWFAVLDELWLTRPISEGVHVDENWHEFGDIDYSIHTDVELAQSCIDASNDAGMKSRGVDYASFPLDSGLIVACNSLGIGTRDIPIVSASNNLYHDAAMTKKLSALAVEKAESLGKSVVLLGIGGISASVFTTVIDPANDRIVTDEEDVWNKKLLEAVTSSDIKNLENEMNSFNKSVRSDMGLKHLSWVLGGLGKKYAGGEVHLYAPDYGSGAAVIEFGVG